MPTKKEANETPPPSTYRIVLQNLDLVENADIDGDPARICNYERDEEVLVHPDPVSL